MLVIEESDGPESSDVPVCPLVPKEGIRNVKFGPKLPADLRADVGQVSERHERILTDLPLRTNL